MAAWGIPKDWRNSFSFSGAIKAPLETPLGVHFGAATSAISGAIPAPFRHHLQHHWKSIFWGYNQSIFRRHTSPVQAPHAAPLKVHFLGLQPVHFQAPYQPCSGTTCSTIESPFFGAATSPFSGTIPALFRHHM